MKSTHLVNLTKRSALLMLFFLPLLVGATGITITVPNSSYHQGDPITVTFVFNCPNQPGNSMGNDDIFLHRRAQRNMGQWHALGRVRDGATSGTVRRGFTIPDSAEEANDYIISVWSGDDTCSGDSSSAFYIEPRSGGSPGTNVFTSPRSGSTFYLGNILWLLWSTEAPWANGVAVKLMSGENVVQDFGIFTGNTVLWTVGRNRLGNAGQMFDTIPAAPGYHFRITQVGRTRYSDSGIFTIAKPGIRLDAPRGGERFYRNEHLLVSWTGDHLAPSARVLVQLSYLGFNRFAGSRPAYKKMLTMAGRDGSFDWVIPLDGSADFPLPESDPIQCMLQISVEGITGVYESSGTFTIDHRR